jgi:plasmid stabilization system protein ParE
VTVYQVFILPQAEAEIEAAFRWYHERSAQAALAFREEAFDQIDALARIADRWKVDEEGTRRCLLKHFPYSVFYEIDADCVYVLAVAHRRREPGYWRKT